MQWIQILVLLLTSHATLNSLLNLTQDQFPYHQNEIQQWHVIKLQ